MRASLAFGGTIYSVSDIYHKNITYVARRGKGAPILQILTFRTVWTTLLGSLIGQFIALLVTASQNYPVPLRFIWSAGLFIEVVFGAVCLGVLVRNPLRVLLRVQEKPHFPPVKAFRAGFGSGRRQCPLSDGYAALRQGNAS